MKSFGKERIRNYVIIDRKISFDEHVTTLCKIAKTELSVLGRLVKFLTLEQRRTLVKAFIESHFAYCQLVRFLREGLKTG